MDALVKLWTRFYEGEFTPRWLRPYKANPCDVDAAGPLKALGEALAVLGSHCKCCSGTRVLVALVAGALWPEVALAVAAGWALVALCYVLFKWMFP